MRVNDVVDTMMKWQLLLLGVSAILVLALLFAGGLLKPGGFKEAGLRDVTTMPAIVWLFAGFVIMLAMSSAPTLISKIQWVHDQQFNETQMQTINLIGAYLFGIIAGLGMLFILSRGAPDCGLKLGFVDMPLGLGCFVLAFPFIQLMAIFGVFAYEQTQRGAMPDPIAHPILQQLVDNSSDPWVWGIALAAVIGAPIVEELIYRVFLQGALLGWLKTPWLSIIIAAIIFAMVHRIGATPVPWHALLPIFTLGLCCGVAYERTKRVGVPITMHICFNALSLIIALTTQPGSPAAPAA